MSNKREQDSVARVIRQFEGWQTRIEQSFQESEDFRSLCQDYAVCERALENWQASNAAVAAERRQQYTELLAELGKEILDWLEHRHHSGHSEAGP